MPGTKHFGRMQYNVSRGLREIVAPRQSMSQKHWDQVLAEFGGLCIFCGSEGTRENRGIIPDHLIPVTRYGELVLGNTVPACQTCNDSRGNREWRTFLRHRFPSDPEAQIARVEAHLAAHDYRPATLDEALSPDEQTSYEKLLQNWADLLTEARALHDSAQRRRGKMG